MRTNSLYRLFLAWAVLIFLVVFDYWSFEMVFNTTYLSWLERIYHTDEAGGSSPSAPTRLKGCPLIGRPLFLIKVVKKDDAQTSKWKHDNKKPLV